VLANRNRRRAKTSGADVKAAIAGSKEVTAELSGNRAEAGREGKREYQARNGKRPSNGKGSMDKRETGSNKFPPLDQVSGAPAGMYVAPNPPKFETAVGRVVSTEVYSDKNFNQKSALIMVPLNQFQVDTMQFPLSANQDTRVNQWTNWMLNLYSLIVRGVQSKNIIVPLTDTFLATPANLGTWLRVLLNVLSGVYAFESMLEMGNYNVATTDINAAIIQNLPQLQALSRRARSYVLPQGLVDWIAMVSGVKLIDDGSCPIWYMGFVTLGAPVDFTVAANVLAQITAMENSMNALLPTAALMDFARIPNTFAKAYPNPVYPKPKVSSDPVEYDWLYNAAACYTDSTAVKNFTWPTTLMPASVGQPALQLIPTFFRDEVPSSSPSEEVALSLWKLAVYSIDPVAGQASGALPNSEIGAIHLTTGSTANDVILGEYDQNGLFNARALTGPGATTLSAAAAPIAEQMYWSTDAAGEFTSNAADHRGPRGYRAVYLSPDWYIDETLRLGEKWFLSEIR